VAKDLAAHGRAARRIAEEYFDARLVLARFLELTLDGDAHRSGVQRLAARAERRSVRGAHTTPAIVSGMVAGVPDRGGATWAVLQYVLGLRQLGRDVQLVEDIPASALTPAGASLEASDNARYFEAVVRAFALEGQATLVLAGTEQTVGLPYRELTRLCDRAGVLFNLSGMLTDPELLERSLVRVYLDLDPAFTQLWAAEGVEMRFGGHTHFATVGLELGSPRCGVPTCGIDWIHTLPPVVLPQWWPVSEPPRHEWTTVAHWRGYGSIERDGIRYGQKAHSFRPLFPLPPCTGGRFEVALDIHPDERADLGELEANGWHLLDPADVAGDPERYRRFVQSSAAEVGIAKSGYVASRCGWFSDRSACYLASGRPVLAHDTGFGEHLPTGLGLLSFRDLDEAADAVAAVRADYRAHARAARRVAEEHLDSDRVLSRLLAEVDA
jgi:hypothetical protein